MKKIIYLSLLFLAFSFQLHADEKTLTPEEAVTEYLLQTQIPMDLKARPSKGKSEAKITIVEFSDFQCPFCKRAANIFKAYMDKYPGKIKVHYLHYPLDPTCNVNIKRSQHKYACVAAYGSYCSGKQGKFWEYHDLLFKNQTLISSIIIKEIGKKLELDSAQFQSCLEDESTKQAIVKDIKLGNELKIRGTPSVFVNGRPFKYWYHPDYFDALVKKLDK